MARIKQQKQQDQRPLTDDGPSPQQQQPQLHQLAIAVAGIYGTFLTWAYLQEKLTTTGYGPQHERWRFPVVLNTVQSVLAAVVGAGYLVATTARGDRVPSVIASRAMLTPLVVVAVTSSLASPFGYASLAHLDYVTFLLAKSCKLVPVMALHVTLFRRRYPRYKYLVVGAVTLGVAVFTLYSSSSSGNKSRRLRRRLQTGDDEDAASSSSSMAWGMLLLAVNLLFDGLTNTTQDYIFRAFRPYSGPQMMCANNIISSLLTGAYLVAGPFLALLPVGAWLGVDDAAAGGELSAALAFVARHPSVCLYL
ncbi:hypothetical protein XA68_14446 [Ophiocordyceps unilateralis]|uniref:UDP-galactose transporter homolog 1 n=1 Tax=Ophiocordyceps unilateralis TaxID=268505 RepID=A0A2A9P9K5_OPHUN|nr:hypothetical protein XA68_14446 [Ophiocordyceps unilateralis]